MSIKKRTPLPTSRPSGTLMVTSNADLSPHQPRGTKRLRKSSEATVEADSDDRKQKRLCQGRPFLATQVIQSLEVNEKTCKPPFTYAQLAMTAILDSPEKSLSVDGICASIEANHEYYSLVQDNTAWRSSVSHSLRACKAFERVGEKLRVKAGYGDRTAQTIKKNLVW